MMMSRLAALLLAAIALTAPTAATDAGLAEIARGSGTPDIPGLKMIWLAPWGDVSRAHSWRNIIVHQTEGPAGSARGGAEAQAKNPTRRGVTVWVETDGTVYWAVAENLVPTHGDGANRNDNKYIDNKATFRQVVRDNSIGVEFAGNYPDVATGPNVLQQHALHARYVDGRGAQRGVGADLGRGPRPRLRAPRRAGTGVPRRSEGDGPGTVLTG